MNFVSLSFILFILLTVLLYYIVPKKFRFIILLIANTVFYVMSCKFNIIYLLISIISVYIAALLIEKYKNKKKLIFLITLILNISLLIFLKEHNHLINTFNNLFNINMGLLKIALPLGISYYTLVALSYIIDVYLGRKKPIKNFFKIYLSMTFFPLMVEGPIVKINEVADSLYEGHDFDYNNFKYGYLRILYGYAKKLVIADRVAVLVDKVFAGGYSGEVVIAAMVLYTIQIYTEFSGCMDIVIGIGRLFNIKIPENFKEPFFSKDISEFWRRWHITLGRWLKDYIFFPITMSKFNMKLNIKSHNKLPRFLADTITSFFPLLGVWFLMGIWHGYGIKFVVYGMYYFILILLGMLLKPLFEIIIKKLKVKTECFSYHFFQMIRTTLLVIIGLTLFRADSITQFINLLKSIFKASTNSIVELIGGGHNVSIVFILLILVFIVDFVKYNGVNIDEWLEKQNITFRYIIFIGLLFFVLIFGMYGYGYNPSSFIYGEF